MEIAQREQNDFELSFFAAHLERFLGKVVKSFVNVGFDSRRRLIGDLNARL